jgi:hypothetical protein
MRMNVRERLDKNQLDDGLFSELEEAVMLRLCRIFDRFSQTEEYKKHIRSEAVRESVSVKSPASPSRVKSPIQWIGQIASKLSPRSSGRQSSPRSPVSLRFQNFK